MKQKCYKKDFKDVYKKLLIFSERADNISRIKNNLICLKHFKKEINQNSANNIKIGYQILKEDTINSLNIEFNNKNSRINNLIQIEKYSEALEEFKKFEKQEKRQTNHR